MEVYVNSSERNVYLDVPVTPVGNSIEVEVLDLDEVVYSPNTVSSNEGLLSFVLPFSLAQSDKPYTVRWQFNYVEDGQTYEYNNTSNVDVITPILPLSDIKTILNEVGEDEFSYEDIARIESAVRFIIQAHTGQFFGKYIGPKEVSGSGESNLRLPSRLISLASINSNAYWNTSIAIRGGGWFLASMVYGVPSIRADYEGWHENPYTASAPVSHPYQSNTHVFIKHANYLIDGVWGWNNVPEAVKQAARLLINDYACGDNNYRDRFLSSMTAADWRIQFHEGAFSNTGNVRANQLLAEFVLRRGWVVI